MLLVFQWEKRSRSLDIAKSCLWCIAVEAALTVQDKKFRACMILSLGVTYGWVRCPWSTLMVLEMMIDLVVASTTWKQW